MRQPQSENDLWKKLSTHRTGRTSGSSTNVLDDTISYARCIRELPVWRGRCQLYKVAGGSSERKRVR